MPSGVATYFHVHLVSDSTGDTLAAMARAVTARFDAVIPIEHAYPLVRSPRQMERVLAEVEDAPGVVVHTIVDRELRGLLEDGCRELDTPCIAALDPLTAALGRYLGAPLTSQVGKQHALDDDYFHRIETLVGVSRTSKTPTCIYLAHRGVRAANVPLAPGVPIPPGLETLQGPLVVGLLVAPERLVQIRRNRLLTLNEQRETAYVEADQVREETIRARRLFEKNGWPVIDVSRRSVEETAAAVLNLLNARKASHVTPTSAASRPA